jgi:N-acetylglucosamine-6-phosphate deacetylase
MAAQFLVGAPILVGGEWRTGEGVLIEGGRVVATLPDRERVDAERVSLPPDAWLAPGLVDIQVNGGGGVLFNDEPSLQAARAMVAAHRRLGTTAILPTLITDTPATMRAAAEVVRAAAGPGSGILGIHYEGPFLSRARPGVHAAELIRPPSEADLVLLEGLAAGLDGRVLVTLAPEMVDDDSLRRLAAAGIVLSAGHSAAPWARIETARAAGLTGFTHLFNAMPPMQAREPGIAAAALLDPDSWCGVIADGIHVHAAMLRLLLACKPRDRIMLVSDSMPTVGTGLGAFLLQGRTILRQDGRLTTQDGTLAGADICLADAVRWCVRALGVAPAQALGMASAVPAAFLRLDDRIGRIAPGCQADLLLLSGELETLGTWLAGSWCGEPGVLPARAAA